MTNAERQAKWRERHYGRAIDEAQGERDRKQAYLEGAEHGYREGYEKAAATAPSNGNGASKLDTKARVRLVKLLGMLGSNQEGERATAAAMASELLRGAKLGWDDVVS